MGKGFLYGLVVAAPILAIILFVALEKDEQTRAERAELATKIEIDSQNFDETFYKAWGDEDKSDRARSLREQLEADLREKQERLAKAEAASEESIEELQKALNAENKKQGEQ